MYACDWLSLYYDVCIFAYLFHDTSDLSLKIVGMSWRFPDLFFTGAFPGD